MAEMFEIKISGLEELRAKFQALNIGLGQAILEATAAAAAVVVREAAINSRKGGEGGVRVNDDFPMLQTGNLKRSITMIDVIKGPERVEIKVGSAMNYANRLEYGFMDTDKKGRRYNQKPRPFLRPALDENKEQIKAEFDKNILDLLRAF
jgi:HK97 gp10 family phage protein